MMSMMHTGCTTSRWTCLAQIASTVSTTPKQAAVWTMVAVLGSLKGTTKVTLPPRAPFEASSTALRLRISSWRRGEDEADVALHDVPQLVQASLSGVRAFWTQQTPALKMDRPIRILTLKEPRRVIISDGFSL